MIPEPLRQAYLATRYRVDASPAGCFCIRIGAPSPEADRLCAAQGQTAWAFVTACNPRSQPLPPAQNAARMRMLETEVAALGLACYPGAGVGEDGDWPPEASLLIIGADRALARRLGQRFNQYAVVVGELGGIAELLDCR